MTEELFEDNCFLYEIFAKGQDVIIKLLGEY